MTSRDSITITTLPDSHNVEPTLYFSDAIHAELLKHKKTQREAERSAYSEESAEWEWKSQALESEKWLGLPVERKSENSKTFPYLASERAQIPVRGILVKSESLQGEVRSERKIHRLEKRIDDLTTTVAKFSRELGRAGPALQPIQEQNLSRSLRPSSLWNNAAIAFSVTAATLAIMVAVLPSDSALLLPVAILGLLGCFIAGSILMRERPGGKRSHGNGR